MNPLIIIQARLNSTRLPGKVLLPIKGKPMLWYLIDRVRKTDISGVVATPDFDLARKIEVDFDRDGIVPLWAERQEDDVAGRFMWTLRAFNCDTFIRLCGDSPLMDPALIDAALAFYEPPYLEIRSPVGSVEVCDTAAFLAALPSMSPHEREHVTGPLRVEGRSLGVGHGPRLVVDTQADLDRVTAVIEKMGRPHIEYGWRECMELARG